MDPRKRVKLCRLLVKIENQIEYCQRSGIKNVSCYQKEHVFCQKKVNRTL